MTTDTPKPEPTAKPKRRKRWLKVLLALIILILLIVLLLPTLLSTGPGKAIILSQVNSRLGGAKISADSISLGWFSGAVVRKFDYHDPTGKDVLTADTIDTGITVWDALTGKTIDLQKFNVSGAGLPDRPDVVVAVKLVGNADLGKKVLNFTGDSAITATDSKTQNVTKVEIPAGSVASWGDLANDIHAVITYHLPDIQPLLAASLPKDAILEGSYTMPLHIEGSLTKDPGLRAIRNFKIDQTKVGEGRIYAEGFDIGKAEIPYHMENGILTIEPTDLPFKDGGRIRVRGKVDFNANPPAFIIDTPDPQGEPFIKDLQLNQKVASGKFRFFPLFWGSIDQQGDVGGVSGKVNVHLDSVYIPLDAEAFKTKGSVHGTLNIQDLTTEAGLFSQIGKVLGPMGNFGNLGKGGSHGNNPFAIKGGNIPDVTFALENGKVTYKDLRLGASVANISFSGSVGLDNSLAMDMQVGVAGVGLPIPIAVKGTTAKPELTLTGKLPTINPADLGKDVGNDLNNASKGLENLFNKKKK